MAFGPRKTTKTLTSMDKRLAKLNARLQIERDQKIYKNPIDPSLKYNKRGMIARQRVIQEQNYKCPICIHWLTEDKRKHYDDYNPITLRPRGILCLGCKKLVIKMKDPKYYRTDVVNYINSWK